MYKIVLNDRFILFPLVGKNYITAAKLDLELNKTGTLTFTIHPSHPHYKRIVEMQSIVTVYQDEEVIFSGRVLNSEIGFYNERQVTCEGELAFLLDSIIRPFDSEESPWSGTITEYMQKLLEDHNSQVGNDILKNFYVGNVTAANKEGAVNGAIERYSTEYKTTLDLLVELVNDNGGYIIVRKEGSKNYIDYVGELDLATDQVIELGKNLLDLKKTVKGEELMTGIIPLGKGDGSGDEITIADVNGGYDYLVHDEAAKIYGRIFKTISFDDVKNADELKEKAIEYLNTAVKTATHVELTAADLADITGVNPFKLGQKIAVIDDYHGLEEMDGDMLFLVKKLSLDLLKPSNNKLTVGETFNTFTDSTKASNTAHAQTAAKVNKIEKKATEFITNENLSTVLLAYDVALGKKANAADVYTKTETQNLVGRVGENTTLYLSESWAAEDTATYYVDKSGQVHFSGIVKPLGDFDLIGNCPYKPLAAERFTVACWNVDGGYELGVVTVNVLGNISFAANNRAGIVAVSLSGISYRHN